MENVSKSENNQQEQPGFFGRTMERIVRGVTKEFAVEGKEHIPKGGCLVVANHSSFFDAWGLAASLAGHDATGVSFADEKDALNNYIRSVLNWMDRRKIDPPIRMVQQVANHVSEEERNKHRDRDTIMGRTIRRGEDSGKRAADILGNLNVLHKLVKDILNGKKVIYFPEGVFFEEGRKELRDTTRGVQVIAKLYKRETGEDLPVLPTGIEGAHDVFGSDPNYFGIPNIIQALRKKDAHVTVRFGEPFTVTPDEDFNKVFQQRVGALLPGEYKKSPGEQPVA